MTNKHFKGLYVNEQMLFYYRQVLSVRIRTRNKEMNLTTLANALV